MRLSVVVLAAAYYVQAIPSYAGNYIFSNGVATALPEVPSSAPGSTAFQGINDSGQAVGLYWSDTGGPCCEFHGFIYSNGSFITIDGPSATRLTTAYDINNTGQIVGAYRPDSSPSIAYGYALSAGVFTTIAHPDATVFTFAMGNNNVGQIVGQYLGPGGLHGFLFQNGNYRTLDFPSAKNTIVLDINDLGQAVGYYYNDDQIQHGFTYQDGIFTELDLKFAAGINNSGQIAGSQRRDGSATSAGILQGGIYYEIPVGMGSDTAWTAAINDNGDVIGGYANISVPEPSTWAMLLIGFAGIGFAAYRRRLQYQ